MPNDEERLSSPEPAPVANGAVPAQRSGSGAKIALIAVLLALAAGAYAT